MNCSYVYNCGTQYSTEHSSDNLHCYPLDNHQSSDDVYWRVNDIGQKTTRQISQDMVCTDQWQSARLHCLSLSTPRHSDLPAHHRATHSVSQHCHHCSANTLHQHTQQNVHSFVSAYAAKNTHTEDEANNRHEKQNSLCWPMDGKLKASFTNKMETLSRMCYQWQTNRSAISTNAYSIQN